MQKVKLKLLVSICFMALSFVLTSGENKVYAATYTVSKTADTNDGTCDADCSLREAITAANSNVGNDTIEFDIDTSDGGYTAPSGSTQGYFTTYITGSGFTLSDADGVYINGYSQDGASRNTAAFGQTINTILNIQLTSNSLTYFTITGSNNHITGLNLSTSNTQLIYINGGDSNWIEGNFFASDITGLTSTSNNAGMFFTNSASSNIVGTNGDGVGDVGERNLFMGGSGQYKILFQTGDVDNNVVAGNYFGVDKTSRTCVTSSQSRAMVSVFAGVNNRVGTNLDGISDSEEANIMGCVNANARALIQLGNDTDTVIQGNYIGTNAYGDDLNSSFVEPGIQDNGVSTGAMIKRNTIRYNGAPGIVIKNSGTSGVTISQNTIFTNVGLGIDLSTVSNGDGVTANDPGDTDTGYNDLMNYPIIDEAGVTEDGDLAVQVDLDFNSSEAPFVLEFFGNATVDSTGYGEGQTYIGTVTTSLTGNDIVLTVPITGTTPTNLRNVTATATNANGATSEFSSTPAGTSGGDVILDEDSPDDFSFKIIDFMDEKLEPSDSKAITVSKRRLDLTLDVDGSGTDVKEMKISEHSDFSGNDWRDFKDHVSFELSEGDEVKYIYFKFEDEAGNDSKEYVQKLILDTTIPRVKLTKILSLEYLPEYKTFYIIGNNASFTGTSEDSVVTVTIDGVRQHYNAIVKLDGSWHVPRFWIGPGTHKILIESHDGIDMKNEVSPNSKVEFTLVNDPTKQQIPASLLEKQL